MFKKQINVVSENQSGGTTSGEINIKITAWKERATGGIIILILELIIYIIKLWISLK